MRCRYKEVTYISGKYTETYVYPVFKKGKGRRGKYRPTGDAQAALNAENSRRRLKRLIECNFGDGDLMVTLSYRDEELPEDDRTCVRDWNNFKRRLERARRKAGLPPMKGICIPEKGRKNGRYHFHVIVNGGLDAVRLKEIWGKGYVRIDPLEFGDVGMKGLANYLDKCPLLTKKYLRCGDLREPEVKEREGKISAARVRELYGLTDCPEEFERQYPGVRVVNAASFYNAFNTQFYLRIDGVKEPPVAAGAGDAGTRGAGPYGGRPDGLLGGAARRRD